MTEKELLPDYYYATAIHHHVFDENGVLFLLVQWQGYEGDPHEFTWERANNLKYDAICSHYFNLIGLGPSGLMGEWNVHKASKGFSLQAYKEYVLGLAQRTSMSELRLSTLMTGLVLLPSSAPSSLVPEWGLRAAAHVSCHGVPKTTHRHLGVRITMDASLDSKECSLALPDANGAVSAAVDDIISSAKAAAIQTPLQDAKAAAPEKKGKGKAMRLVYSDNDVSPEEKMAIHPKYEITYTSLEQTTYDHDGDLAATSKLASHIDESYAQLPPPPSRRSLSSRAASQPSTQVPPQEAYSSPVQAPTPVSEHQSKDRPLQAQRAQVETRRTSPGLVKPTDSRGASKGHVTTEIKARRKRSTKPNGPVPDPHALLEEDISVNDFAVPGRFGRAKVQTPRNYAALLASSRSTMPGTSARSTKIGATSKTSDGGVVTSSDLVLSSATRSQETYAQAQQTASMISETAVPTQDNTASTKQSRNSMTAQAQSPTIDHQDIDAITARYNAHARKNPRKNPSKFIVDPNGKLTSKAWKDIQVAAAKTQAIQDVSTTSPILATNSTPKSILKKPETSLRVIKERFMEPEIDCPVPNQSEQHAMSTPTQAFSTPQKASRAPAKTAGTPRDTLTKPGSSHKNATTVQHAETPKKHQSVRGSNKIKSRKSVAFADAARSPLSEVLTPRSKASMNTPKQSMKLSRNTSGVDSQDDKENIPVTTNSAFDHKQQKIVDAPSPVKIFAKSMPKLAEISSEVVEESFAHLALDESVVNESDSDDDLLLDESVLHTPPHDKEYLKLRRTKSGAIIAESPPPVEDKGKQRLEIEDSEQHEALTSLPFAKYHYEKQPPTEREQDEIRVRFLRHRLQDGLLQDRNRAESWEMEDFHEWMVILEEYYCNLDDVTIRSTKIDQVLLHIVALAKGRIPDRDRYSMRKRSKRLLKYWSRQNEESYATLALKVPNAYLSIYLREEENSDEEDYLSVEEEVPDIWNRRMGGSAPNGRKRRALIINEDVLARREVSRRWARGER